MPWTSVLLLGLHWAAPNPPPFQAGADAEGRLGAATEVRVMCGAFVMGAKMTPRTCARIATTQPRDVCNDRSKGEGSAPC